MLGRTYFPCQTCFKSNDITDLFCLYENLDARNPTIACQYHRPKSLHSDQAMVRTITCQTDQKFSDLQRGSATASPKWNIITY